ncbi:MAG: aminopeptidase [Lachnospiraceae bacterium]|nr:aminopeptidase [Lachnospiraceae bacterium]
MEERFILIRDRIAEIENENVLTGDLVGAFRDMAHFIMDAFAYYDEIKERGVLTRTEYEKWQDRLFYFEDPKNYDNSFLCPKYAVEKLGDDGRLLAALFADMQSLRIWAAEKNEDMITIFAELFVQIYCCYSADSEADPRGAYEGALDAFRSFYYDYMDDFCNMAVVSQVRPATGVVGDILKNADLNDTTYLYRYGIHVGENELSMAEFLNAMSEDEIEKMARTYTEGYRIGFDNTGKDIGIKEVVGIHYPIGFERMVRAAIRQFNEIGLDASVIREPFLSFMGRGKGKQGCYTTSLNKQFEYDHKDDKSLYYDKAYVERRLECLDTAFSHNADMAKKYGGPAVIEVFGESRFDPKNDEANTRLSEKQQHLDVHDKSRASEITYTYIPGEERSFTIISYPLPCIGDNFDEIFKKVVEINTLDYVLYRDMQQRIIDVLDRGYQVRVHGSGENRTDIVVKLHELTDPKRQTNFENCVADVNIPVGEVFTSPVLEGTQGVLNVSFVYLGDYTFKDLQLTFKDGMVTDYTCSNFEKEEENRRFIEDNILFHHESLPIGEFAIGTNTTAYRAGRDLGISDRYPILIAEKTGPHFAVGDTCYSREEDVVTKNPDGKEIVARDNSVSILRKSDNPEKAYFNCHTDITIPFAELGYITVDMPDGTSEDIIRDGRFVVPGTEPLNIPLDE